MAEPQPHRRVSPLLTLARSSPAACFILNSQHRLRYVNPAWEQLTGRPWDQVRGTRVSVERQSASPLWRSLVPPPEVWAGQALTVRRAPPDQECGPPWWDIAFLPIPDSEGNINIVATVRVSGSSPSRVEYREPAALAALRHRHAQRFACDRLTGRSVSAERLQSQVRLAARSLPAIWLTGEAGTGKETIARIIHHNGPSAERAFVAVPCGSIEAYLIEALLFGKGGLLGSHAVGTLYLASPQRLPPLLQSQIAEWFDASSAHGPRLICSGPRSPGEELADGSLIPPFHTRLCVTEMTIPPLRSHLADLPSYLERMLPELAQAWGRPLTLAPECLAVLLSYHWPGNLRELRDVLASAGHRAEGDSIRPQHLPRFLQEKHLIVQNPLPPKSRTWTLDQVLESVERRLIEQALADQNGSQTAAAEQLGIFRTRLGRRIEALGLSPESRKPT
ncbi:MAG: sigma 54-interacting transcriptional regulator [Bacteroidales bacterium]|nr:sigma 54-interacting transcriptional regulator [Bacteroidales bacterium]